MGILIAALTEFHPMQSHYADQLARSGGRGLVGGKESPPRVLNIFGIMGVFRVLDAFGILSEFGVRVGFFCEPGFS